MTRSFFVAVVILFLAGCSKESEGPSEFVRCKIVGGEKVKFSSPKEIEHHCNTAVNESVIEIRYEDIQSDRNFSIRLKKVQYDNPFFDCTIDLDDSRYYILIYTVSFDEEYNIEYNLQNSNGELNVSTKSVQDVNETQLLITFTGEMQGFLRKKDSIAEPSEQEPVFDTLPVIDGSISVFIPF